MSFYFEPPTNSKIVNVPTIKYGRVGVESCLYYTIFAPLNVLETKNHSGKSWHTSDRIPWRMLEILALCKIKEDGFKIT